jgi:hypothetical protein
MQGVEAEALKPLSLIPTPNGVAPPIRRGSSTGVSLNGFFVFHALLCLKGLSGFELA